MRGERLQAALDGYAKFLCEKDLSLPKQRSNMVRLVREFLLFAREFHPEFHPLFHPDLPQLLSVAVIS